MRLISTVFLCTGLFLLFSIQFGCNTDARSVGTVGTDEETQCGDGIDNDGDGQTDCYDNDCWTDWENCRAIHEWEACSDGVDNDGNGQTDCEDWECENDPSCRIDEDCTNGVDDDADGFVDCDDTDCLADPACSSGEEICANGLDDDFDGFVDCDDSDCFNHPICAGPETNCYDGADNDGDGYIDCVDLDCVNDPFCHIAEVNCTNGQDDDNDGFVDCDDIDCSYHVNCHDVETNCSDGQDNDTDGYIDCVDTDCFASAACQGTENCLNGLDDDGDGFVDCADPDCAGDPYCGFSCQALNLCYWCCPAGDLNCYDACDNAAHPQGLQEMYALLTCAEPHCTNQLCRPFWDCFPCAESFCRPAMDVCGTVSQGNLGCNAMMGCMNNCPVIPNHSGSASTCGGDPGTRCVDQCFKSATPQGGQLYVAFLYCMFHHCFAECYASPDGTQCEQCMTQHCTNAMNQCLND